MKRSTIYTHGIAVAVGFLLAVVFSWKAWGDKAPDSTVVYKERVVYKDGSTTAEVRPVEKAKPKTEVPKGDKPTGTATIVIHDTTRLFVECPDGTSVQCPPCPDDSVWLTISEGKGGKNITAKVNSGKEITSFVSYPVAKREKVRAAGVVVQYRIGDTAPYMGVFYQRGIGPAVVGMSVVNSMAGVLDVGVGASFGMKF